MTRGSGSDANPLDGCRIYVGIELRDGRVAWLDARCQLPGCERSALLTFELVAPSGNGVTGRFETFSFALPGTDESWGLQWEIDKADGGNVPSEISIDLSFCGQVLADGGCGLRITTAYDTQGNAYLITSFDAASGGNIVNQVQRDFNGLGQLTEEWQSHAGSEARWRLALSSKSRGAMT